MTRLFPLLFLALLLAGCAALPPRVPQAPSYALVDVAGSRIALVAAASLPADRPAASGFRFLPEGESAFNARLALARTASRSLDVQYYLLQADETGLAFVRELRAAARRGVRVRLIVDDLYAAREDALLAALATEPGFELRIFNPLPARAGSFALRLLLSLHEFGRINHRMHNKLFVADNSCAVSGGRNIANEYFMRNPQANFIDLDVLSCGAVVRELSAVFDSYWNSEQVFAIGQLVPLPARDEAARWLDERLARAPAELEERALDVLGGEPVARQLQAGRLALVPGQAQVFADSPAKVAGLAGEAARQTVTEQTLALFAQAREEVHIASPYFIPGERGLAMMRAVGATQENGRISLVTNSLGATDEPFVHAGYARYRREMLKAGVRIYELSPTLAQRSGRLGNFGRSLSRLHAKAATIDRRIVFIGSMNMDPRSAYLNTELGLAIDSPELAAVMGRLFREDLATGAYRLRLAADGGQIEWVETAADGSTTVHADEPDDRWWWRLERWLLSPLVGDRML